MGKTATLLLTVVLLASTGQVRAADPKPAAATAAPSKPIALELAAGDAREGGVLRLRGSDARRQLLVTAKFGDGSVQDYSRRVKYELKPGGIVSVDAAGFVTPLRDGTTTITARSADGTVGKMTATVEKFRNAEPINFGNQIVPIFTKTGCNGGGCHGKAAGKMASSSRCSASSPMRTTNIWSRKRAGAASFPPRRKTACCF